MLAAVAVAERMPVPAVAKAFDLTKQEVITDIVLFRDLLVSRAREQGFVHNTWTPSATDVAGWLRELSFAVSGHWNLLLSPREREELRHVRFVVLHFKRLFRQTLINLKGSNHA